MTQDEHRASRGGQQTQPDGIAARTKGADAPEPSPVDSAPLPDSAPPPDGSGRTPFNPWRFGFHTVSPDHRQELMAMDLPETPPERLFNPNALDDKKELSTPAPPALTVDSPDGEPGAADASRKADTLRLRRSVTLVHPLRLTGAWAGAAAIVIAVALWLLLGGGQAEHGPSGAVASTPMAVPPPVATNTLPPATAEPSRDGTAVNGEPADPAPLPKAIVSPPKKSGAAPAAAASTSNLLAPAVSTQKVPAAQSPAAAQPKDVGSDDAASPFGKWTAPPRD